MTTMRRREWRGPVAAGVKALIWGTLGPSLLYAVVLSTRIIFYNMASSPLAFVLERANSMFLLVLRAGVALVGPIGALSALAITWQTFRWTARGDHVRWITGKALALGALCGFLAPVWIVLRLAVFQRTTFSGRFESLDTFIYMVTNTMPLGLISTWILLLLIRSNLRSWRRPLNA